VAELRVDQRDLQGNILAGYNYDHALFMVLRVTSPEIGREWLSELVTGGRITTAVPFGDAKPATTTNVAFTHDGLRALGLSEEALRSFPAEFRHGMAARAQLLGDRGPNAPARWETGLRPGDPHVLVTFNARSADALAERRAEVERQAPGGDAGLGIVHAQAASVIRRGDAIAVREHFGFADGLAQPSIAGFAADGRRRVGPKKRRGQGTPRPNGGWKRLAPGEFVLGYPDEAGDLADRPMEPLRRSGSYMVLRKLRQNVALFNRFLRDAADGDDELAELLAAKIVGRWRDGTPIATSPERPDELAGSEPTNDFRYRGDPHGLRCPIGAHVRRANPRDSLGFRGRLTSRHRIIRRGMPYGREAANSFVEDGLERGLMFVCYQADIERQFEVVQGRWLADGDAFKLGEDADFLLGTEDPTAKMIIPGSPPRILSPGRSFVVNRGGGYFFAPGIAALRAIAEGV
jgi:Dyp-type peroxidase family